VPRFTVLLPTHAHPRTLGIAIRSVLDQTERDIELFVVGDGCGDDTREIVKGFPDPRLRFFDLPKAPGVGYANRNAALREASGDLIAHASDDDIFFPRHLELLGDVFDTPKVQWAHCRPLFVTTTGLLIPEYATLKLPPARKTFMERICFVATGNVAHRRALLDEVDSFDETFESKGDWDLWKRMLGAIGFQRRPTLLHFNTDRRTGKAAENWPKGLAFLQAIALYSNAWPRQLRLTEEPVGETVLLQQVAWDQMQADKAFQRKVWSAVELLQDHLAWTAARHDALI
jgi:glycosyltransferase involved in cell wall biosynthesis